LPKARDSLALSEGQHPDHHALVGLGRMAGNGQGMLLVVMPIHVGDLQVGLEDGGFERHGMCSCWKRQRGRRPAAAKGWQA
jgi:hypothetical protein